MKFKFTGPGSRGIPVAVPCFAKGDRVQLRVGSKPRGYVKAHVFPGLLCVVFDRKDTLGRKQWLCEPRELEPATVCRRVGKHGIGVFPDTRKVKV